MSEPEMIIYLVSGILATTAIVVWIVQRTRIQHRERKESLEKAMRNLGLSFHGESDESAGKLLAPHPLGKCGAPKGAAMVGRGQYRDHQLVTFEYTYVVHTGKNSYAVTQTVVVLGNEHNFPDLDMGAESFLDRFKEYFGSQDIDFSSHPDFSNKYRLRGEDEESIRDLFRPRVREYFEKNDKIQLDIKGDQILIYRPGKYCKSGEELEPFLQQVVEIKEVLGGKGY